MENKIQAFKKHVADIAANPEFVHHKWFTRWHLEIVERIALELCEYYPQADRNLVEVMAWLHDYGKILDFDHQYDRALLDKGRDKLLGLEFDKAFADRAADYIEMLDKKLEIDVSKTPIEVQIISSADGCSHLVGPFIDIFWHEATDKTFTNKTYQQLMQINRKKIEKDWRYKIVLPEARRAFESRYRSAMERSGMLPERFLAGKR